MNISFPKVEVSGCHDASVQCETKEVSLILKPERVIACKRDEVQFQAFLRTPEGEVAISANVSFASTNTAALTIDASTGLATLVAAGTSTVSAAWQDKMAFANVKVLGVDGTCCDAYGLAIQVVIDASLSMRDEFNEIYKKLDAAKVVSRSFTDQIRIENDLVGLAYFNTNFHSVLDIGSVLPGDGNYAEIEQTTAATILSSALSGAMSNLESLSASQNIIVLFSDGDNRPAVAKEDDDALISMAKDFKDGGGIIIVVGIRAFGHAFDLLQKVASVGYFLNIYGDGVSPVNSAIATLGELMTLFCAASKVQLLYLYNNPTIPEPGIPVSAQTPDPLPIKCVNEPL